MAVNQPSNIPILTDAIANEDETPMAPLETDALLGGRAAEAHRTDTPLASFPPAPPRDTENLIAELQTELASASFSLTEELLRTAFSEMEAKLHQQISARLRSELPELIDSLLREHLDRDGEL